MAVRQFYQIYRDAVNFVELFDIDETKLKEKYGIDWIVRGRAKIIAAILESIHSIEEFYGGQKQYRVLERDGTEIKFTNPFGCELGNRHFIQVSATSFERAKEVFDRIVIKVKRSLEEADEK